MDEKKRQVWRFVIQTAISILTAIATALGVTSCMAAVYQAEIQNCFLENGILSCYLLPL